MKISKSLKRFKKLENRFQNFIKHLNRLFKSYPVIFSLIVSILFLCLTAFLVLAIANWEWFELKSKHELGDAFGGLTNPIIAIFGVIVTFLAFYIQYKFNREQSKLIAQQRFERINDKNERDEEIAREQFDRKFYELLKMHNDTVKEFNIDNKYLGRKCFVKIYNELEIITAVVNHYIHYNGKKENIEFDSFELCYSILFHGVEIAFQPIQGVCYNEIEKKVINRIKEHLEQIQNNFENRKALPFYNVNNDDLEISIYGIDKLEKYYIDYYPFDGHSHRLNHYFRHLYNFLKIIYNSKVIDDFKKKEYVDIVRAQLSNYEQAILYYNIIAWFPNEWYLLVKDYTVIKNLPKELSNLYIMPEIYYSKEIQEMKSKNIKIFEWVELNN